MQFAKQPGPVLDRYTSLNGTNSPETLTHVYSRHMAPYGRRRLGRALQVYYHHNRSRASYGGAQRYITIKRQYNVDVSCIGLLWPFHVQFWRRSIVPR